MSLGPFVEATAITWRPFRLTKPALPPLYLRHQPCEFSLPSSSRYFQRYYSISSNASSPPYQQPIRRSNLAKVILIFVPIFTFGLGTWQIQRLRWKVNLIRDLEERMSKAPIPLPKRLTQESVIDYEYRRVLVTGKFDHAKEIIVGPRTRGDAKAGWILVTPLERPDGSRLLVKRGWIDKDKRDPRTRLNSWTEGDVTIEGRLRKTEQKGIFTPENAINKNEWYWVDVNTMAAVAGTEPVLVEQISEMNSALLSQYTAEGIPIGAAPMVELRNTHLQYAITWYSLSAATAAMLYVLFR